MELFVLLLGSEVCNHSWVAARWYPRQVHIPTAVHEEDVAAIFPANTRYW